MSQMALESMQRQIGAPRSRRSALRQLGGGGLAAATLGVLPRAGSAAAASPGRAAANDYAYRLQASKPLEFDGGMLQLATRKEFPVLAGMAIQLEQLDPGALQVPHWHPNAGEVHYVAAGTGAVGIVSPGGERATFDVRAGSVSFFPRGHYHYVQNTGNEPLQVLAAFTHEEPTLFRAAEVIGVLPTPILAQVLGVDADQLPAVPAPDARTVVAGVGAPPPLDIEPPATPPAPYTLNLDDLEPVAYEGGTVTNVRGKELARLEGISFLPLAIDTGGLREPHWHPNAAELIYVVSGEAEIGLVDPDGTFHQFTIGAGDLAYFPTNWFHYVASIGPEPLDSIVYLSHAAPSRIDLSDMVAFLPPQVTAASLGLEPDVLADLPHRPSIVVAAAPDQQ